MADSLGSFRATPLAPRWLARLSLSLSPLLRQPLFWVLLATGAVLIVVAGTLSGQYNFTVGDRAERLYLKDGFDGLEHGPAGDYRWTHETALVTLPHVGPGPITVH